MPMTLTKHQVEMRLAALEEFERGFRPSRRGNLWRNYEGVALTIFKRDDGYYGWCIAGPEERRFSTGGYDTEEDAMSSLAREIGVGE